MTPDEHQYQLLATCARVGALGQLKHAPAVPSPARWLWAYWVAVFPHLSAWPSRAFALLQPWSTVALWSGGRYLQDGAVGALTLAAIAAAHWGPWWSVALAVAVLLSVKEAAVIALPAVLVAGAPGETVRDMLGAWPTLAGITSGLALWTIAGLIVFRRAWFPLLRASVTGHKTDYQTEHQQASPHVSAAMMVIICPAVLLMGTGWEFSVACALFAGMVCSPVQNIRLLGAVEGLAWFGAISGGEWWLCAIAALAQALTVLSLKTPGTGWKDSRGTVDLVPLAIVEALRK